MKVALISDIHANLEALEAVLKDIETRRVDAIHCLGDVIGYGCNPRECLELVSRHCGIILQGNHEAVMLGLLGYDHLNKLAKVSMDWTRNQITEEDLSIMEGFSMDARIEGAYLVHSSPYHPDQWYYILSPSEAEAGLKCLPDPIGFFGHTHLPYAWSISKEGACRSQVSHDFDPDPDNRYLVNVGSVGQPRDNDPRSCYVIYDSKEQTIRYHRVEYDIAATQKRMTAANTNKMLIDRLVVGR